MNYPRIAATISIAALVASLAACSGGGGSSLSGIGGTGVTTVGTITGFGSIFVNGVEYETTSTSFEVDDASGSESDLRVGMVVRIEGTIDANGTTGTATRVSFDAELEGPINGAPTENADQSAKTFSLLGTTVVASASTTVYENTSYATLAGNDMVEVSGFFDANGQLQATYIEKKTGAFAANSTEVEAKGTVTGLGASSFILQMASGATLTVDISGSPDTSEVNGGTLANGQYVEVKGTLASAGATTLTATRIESEDLDDDAGKVSLEGIVRNYVSDANFQLGMMTVDASAARFEPATLVLGDGIEIEVEGTVSNGVLTATEIEARGGNIEIEAPVASVDTTAGTVTLTVGTGSVTVLTNSQTRMEDEVLNREPFTLADISSGDFLEIEAHLDGSGNVVADKLKRDSASATILQASLDSVASPNVTLLGVTFDTSGASFEDANDNGITSGTFFSSASTGDLVKIKDSNNDGTAEEVEFEN
ncbi:DUF5666 domain-containing protein [Thiohalobacter sp.]|uniref:DUF5666 domain-containing protein n=1 Tax=Thiohalobacter sp. TaxID=2025948 RepID=UPI0026343D9A|nr:DUF5666 domain-containing protein [Thiohalobacter sp.]